MRTTFLADRLLGQSHFPYELMSLSVVASHPLEPEMRRAIICGSGVAGLSAAISLASRGWSTEVYERSDSVREIGAGIFLKGNSLRVLQHHGVLERILRDGVVLREARILHKSG